MYAGQNVAILGANFSGIDISFELAKYTQKVGLWRLTPLSLIFQLHFDDQLCWLRKPEYPAKNTDLSEIRQTLSHDVVSRTPRHERDSNSQL
jgi:cation diffusion facilitator CzcD-associated flavoprotein CzcO